MNVSISSIKQGYIDLTSRFLCHLEDVDLGLGILRTDLLDASTSKGVTRQNRLIQVLTGDDPTKESTSKGIAGAVGIHDLVICEHVDGEDLWLLGFVSGDQHGIPRAMGEHNDAIAGGVVLGKKGNRVRDTSEVFGIGVTIRARPCLGFGFVTNDDVDIGQDLFQLGAKELGDEGCREV